MRKIRVSIATVAIVSLLMPISSVDAESIRPISIEAALSKPAIEVQEDHRPVLHDWRTDELENRVFSDWASSGVMMGGMQISVRIATDGKFYDVELVRSSGNAQYEADCLQAVFGVGGYRRFPEIPEGSLAQYLLRFESTRKPSYNGDAVDKYWNSHPEQKGTCVAFYRIPLDVLKRYPGAFTKEELLAVSNIGVINYKPKVTSSMEQALDNSAIHRLQSIYSGIWVPFFLEHPTATREQLLEVRNTLPPCE